MQIPALNKFLTHFNSGPSDVVGIDVGSAGTRAVRMRKGNSGVSVLAADILPPVQLPDKPAKTPGPVQPLSLPPRLKARYAALAVTSQEAIVKLLTFPGAFDVRNKEKIIERMGIKDSDGYRIACRTVSEGHGKTESRILAVALPEIQAQAASLLLPAGRPAPYSLELSCLAVMTGFLHVPGAQHNGDCVGLIDFGSELSSLSFFNKAVLVLFRTFDFGANTILNRITATLDIDMETAMGIVADGAFDISHLTGEPMERFLRQLVVCRDFVERHEDCHVSKVYVSGGLAVSCDLLSQIRSSLDIDVDTWNPFEGMTLSPDAFPENLSGQESQFRAAVGACLAHSRNNESSSKSYSEIGTAKWKSCQPEVRYSCRQHSRSRWSSGHAFQRLRKRGVVGQ